MNRNIGKAAGRPAGRKTPSAEGRTPLSRSLAYSLILTGATYIFPLIVYPYVSRVLGVSNIGLVGFVDSLATYFILFSMMGISVLGVREISAARGDRRRLSSTFCNLLSLHAGFTAVALVIFAAVVLAVPSLRAEWRMMGIGMMKLVFNLFLIEWYYKGLERYGYITLRTVIIRTAYVAAVFLCVKDSGDVEVYYFLTMTVVAATALANMAFALPRLSLKAWSRNLRVYLRPYVSMGIYILLQAAYTTLSVVYLGAVGNDTEVGYYTTATRLFGIIFSIYMSFLTVLVPRMTRLAGIGRDGMMRKYVLRTAAVIIGFGVPATIAGECFTHEIVALISGPGYEGAVLPMRIILPLTVISGLEQLLVINLLTPLHRDSDITRISGAGALLALILNLALVRSMGAVGSAVVWLACETLVLILSAAVAFRRLPLRGRKAPVS